MNNKYEFIDEVDTKGKKQHLHTLNGKPLLGVSTVLSVMAKPLTWWASGLAVGHLGWTHHKDGKNYVPLEQRLSALQPKWEAIQQMSPTEFLTTLDEAYKAHSVRLGESATAGTDMHSELENYVKRCITTNDRRPLPALDTDERPVAIFAEWADQNIATFVASEAYCYSDRLWVGGIVDLIYEDKYGDINLLDFKSAKEAYDEHFIQNAGYDILLSENGIFEKKGECIGAFTRCPVAYWSLPFGMPNPSPQPRVDTEALKLAFEACVLLYKFKKGIDIV